MKWDVGYNIFKKALRIYCYTFTLTVFTRVILSASNEAPDWTDLIVHVTGLTAIVTFFLVKDQYSKNDGSKGAQEKASTSTKKLQ